MSTLRTLLVALFATLWSATALAWGPRPGALEIDNRSGEQAEVYVDGQWRGSVRPGDDRTFSVSPGRHHIEATGRSGLRLFADRLDFHTGRTSAVRLAPPLATLVLVNDGPVPLYVDTRGIAPFWMLPGARHELDLPPGPATVTTQIAGRFGPTPVGSTSLALLGGRRTVAEIGWQAPPATSRLTMVNHQRRTLRVYVGGQEVGVLRPGASDTFQVRPGRHQVTVVEHGGDIFYNQAVTFAPRKDHTVQVLADAYVHQGRPSHPRPHGPPSSSRPVYYAHR